MSERDDKICRLCLNIDNEFEIIDETTKEMFNILMLQLNFGVSSNPVICRNCAEIATKCFYFKSLYADTEELILSLAINRGQAVVDLNEIYEDIASVADYFNVCRFCMYHSKRSSFISLRVLMEVAYVEDMMSLFMPEVDLDIVKNPIVCTTCKEKLEYYLKFAQNCLDVEEKINIYRRDKGANIMGQISLNSVMHYLPNNVKYPKILAKKQHVNVFNIIETDYCQVTKTEEVSDVKDEFRFNKNICETPLDADRSKSSHVLTGKAASEVVVCKYKTSTYGTKGLRTRKNVEIRLPYECAVCTYETKHKSCLNYHMRRHTIKSKEEIYKCSMCSFQAKHKSGLNYHILSHKDKSQVEMYKCATCNYETKHKRCLKSHILRHQKRSKVETYKCAMCSFETRYKSGLKYHVLGHKDKSQVDMYKCAMCNYETRYKGCVKSHMKIHRSKMRTYETKCKIAGSLKKGSLKKQITKIFDT